MSIDKILEYVKRTNPGMTKQKLIEEMAVCRYSANSLIITANTTPKSLTVNSQNGIMTVM